MNISFSNIINNRKKILEERIALLEKVKREIQLVLGNLLPETSYDRLVFSQKVDVAFQHFYELAQTGRGFAA